MRALVQRVARASVSVDGRQVSAIGPGLLVLLGIAPGDTEQDVDRLAAKVLALRIFADAQGRMNEPLRGGRDGGGGGGGSNTRGEDDSGRDGDSGRPDRRVLCVSQFTLYAETARGNRPSFTGAAAPEHARPLYERFCERTEAARGVFGAHMQVELVNDGPVTLLLET